jgi:hypothetical protein
LSVSASVEQSITSPVMTGPGRRLFAMLGQLPDGIAERDLTELLPEDGWAAVATLRQLGLVFDEDDRLRMLAPIREHAAAHHRPTTNDQAMLVEHYCTLAKSGHDIDAGKAEGGATAARLAAEVGNLGQMVVAAVDTDDPRRAVDCCPPLSVPTTAPFRMPTRIGQLGRRCSAWWRRGRHGAAGRLVGTRSVVVTVAPGCGRASTRQVGDLSRARPVRVGPEAGHG